MIIMKKVSFLRAMACVCMAGLTVFSSCEEKVDLSAEDAKSVENEAAVDSYFEDTDDMANLVVAAERGTVDGGKALAGRSIDKNDLDSRFACTSSVNIVFADDSTPQIPHGIISIDFGTSGCTDARGNIRNGTIIVEFRGRRFTPGSTYVTTLLDYEINGIRLEGKRTLTITQAINGLPTATVVLTDGKAIWPDGTVATREMSRIRSWLRVSNGLRPFADLWTISGTASGTNRNESVYELNITKPLVYKRECVHASRIFIAVEGTKELTVDGKKIIIDYGSGECDRLVMLTTLGTSREVEVTGDI